MKESVAVPVTAFARPAARGSMLVMRCAMTTMRTARMFVAAVALAACAIAPALACATRQTPELAWNAIDRTLPHAALSEGDRTKVVELRTKAFAALADAKRQVPRTVEAAQYKAEAEAATQQAIGIVGLVWRQAPGGRRSRACGGSYQLKGALVTD